MAYANVSPSGMNRGGVVMLIRQRLLRFVEKVTMNVDGQIWLLLTFLSSIQLGGVYVAPCDSPYFEQAQWGAVAAHIAESPNTIVMGDLNARVGTPQLRDAEGRSYEYRGVKDHTVNAHGRHLLNMCGESGMVICNHLVNGQKNFGGDLSFRRRRQWISEIDLCLAKPTMLSKISDLAIRQDIHGSDHAPLCVSLDMAGVDLTDVEDLRRRSAELGMPYAVTEPPIKLSRSPKHTEVDKERLAALLQDTPPPQLPEDHADVDLESATREACDAVSAAAQRCRLPRAARQPQWDAAQPRWERILATKDPKIIWRSVGWKGKPIEDTSDQPSESEFKIHFENLLGNGNANLDCDFSNAPVIPVLDDPFHYNELNKAVKGVNKNKSYVGICPGIISILPIPWLLYFLTLFNLIFKTLTFPSDWSFSKLFVLFKSGTKRDCNNYRGISIVNSAFKLFDIMILNRIKLWANIDACQAGAQTGRGCLEQIFSIRLACDYAIFKKQRLFLLFVDFQKAYDVVPRDKLIDVLKINGCGKFMLRIIQAMYKCTKSVLKSAVIITTAGIKQGSPSSCYLFIIYINEMVKMMRRRLQQDGFLGLLHMLLLMDDTVLLATNREMCMEKLKVIVDYCEEFGMKINMKKTKFLVINGTLNDRLPFGYKGIIVKNTSQYLYLGAWVCESGRIKDVIKLHEEYASNLINKFSIFCSSNTNMPFKIKREVFNSAVTSALIYSTESWCTNNIKPIEAHYHTMIRCLMGVRSNTSVKLCMLEAGIPPLSSIIKQNRQRFLASMFSQVRPDVPFHQMYAVCAAANTPAVRFIRAALEYRPPPPLDETRRLVRDAVNATKFNNYSTTLNPGLSVSAVYTSDEYIPDYQRTSYTRLRVMSHSLKVETGRWSRIPADQRVCECDGVSVQDEEHVLVACPRTQHLRQQHPRLTFTSASALLDEHTHVKELCLYVHQVLEVYK